MIDDHDARPPKPFVPGPGSRVLLLLDGQEVGTIRVGGWDSSYTYGTFAPGDAFAAFAPLFGRWSLLMHDDEDAPLHRMAGDALRDAERQIDALHVEVHYVEADRRASVRQLNIDGDLVEWKEV